MLTELKIYLILLALACIVLIILWFTGKKALVRSILKLVATKVEWYFIESGNGCQKLSKALELFNVELDKMPIITKGIIKLIFTQAKLTKILDNEIVPEINQVVKPQVEKVVAKVTDVAVEKLVEKINLTEEPSTNSEVIEMAKVVASSDKSNILSVIAEAKGNTRKEGVDWNVSAGYAKKF